MSSVKYLEEYRSKLVTVDEAVQVVKSGDLVQYGEFIMNSAYLDAALAKRIVELHNVNIRTVTCPFPPKTVLADPERKHLIYDEYHMSAASRKLHDKHLCNYIPICYREINSFYDRGYVSPDVAFIKVAPMDNQGFFNFGPAVSCTPSVCDASKIIIAEVNNRVPICLGGSRESIHISQIDYIVEGDNQPLLELPDLPISDIDRKIASIIMEEIEDGACLQLGIGALPNAVGSMIAQSDLKDLGVHTEMFCDSFMEMYEAGRITGRCKQVDKRKMVYTFAMGSSKLYSFINRNPSCAIYPVEYTNNPFVIGQNNKAVTINNAIEIDLYGQVSSESYGFRHISGSGGQMDFTLGSYISKGGKGLICMASTFTGKDGTVRSRIKPTLTPGSIVTVPRSVNFYVITEYGKAMLKAKSTWQRAEALINIAHPDIRDELIKEADRMKIWIRTNKVPY